ncbi:TetR/AcrR family transcriptional regulator [Mycolicibacterium sphagni]|uniref:TetR/AcrR family transcriptional regulator n=1 Tax=Mycolicibacterium sphagni TaxID=1786 RepID=UPI0021F36DDF|nr:TetR/AcrR family transcriptional regulator [Mycolicibacterium sphagni]MCV7177051.1 TetR/AcrR family transcriptional regulator [Mycolicibacterium sphagni]
MPRNSRDKSQNKSAAKNVGDAYVRIIESARELFMANGYQATTTKEISLRAEVAEPTLFRRFGSKADIFEASVLPEIAAFIENVSSTWVEFSKDATYQEMAENLVNGLYSLIFENRRVFQELLAARADPSDDLHSAAAAISVQLRRGLRLVHDAGRKLEEERGLVGLDPPATVGSIAGLIIGAALLDDWIFPSGVRIPGRGRMITEMSKLIADGIAHRSA